MALVLKDRVKETSITTGTGTFTLAGAVTGYQSFSVIGDGNLCYYTIQNTDSGFEGEWEVGIGTYTASGTTLSRDTILSSSTGGAAINFSAGTKIVFVTYPAEKAVTLGTTSSLSENTVPFSTSGGHLTTNGNFQYDPLINHLAAPVFYGTNGIVVYSNIISNSYIIPSNSTAFSYGPIATAAGVSLAIPSGQKWTVLTQI